MLRDAAVEPARNMLFRHFDIVKHFDFSLPTRCRAIATNHYDIKDINPILLLKSACIALISSSCHDSAFQSYLEAARRGGTAEQVNL